MVPTHLLLLFFFGNCLVSKEGKENIVTNLDGVNVQQTLRRGDEGKVDGVCLKEEENRNQ